MAGSSALPLNLNPVYGSHDDTDHVSALSPSPSSATRRNANHSPRPLSSNPFSGAGIFRSPSRNSGYRQMHDTDGGHEMTDLEDTNSNIMFDGEKNNSHGLGISMTRNDGRLPISGSPPETPGSNQGLLDNTSSGASPATGLSLNPSLVYPPTTYLSPDVSRPAAMSASTNGPGAIWSPAMPSSSRNQKDSDDESIDAKGIPVPEPGSRGLLSSGHRSTGRPEGFEPRGEVPDDDFDDDAFYRKFQEPPSNCWSSQDIHQKRSSWLSVTIYVLSIYSTIASGIWLVTAILQPRWGLQISSKHGLLPSTATTLSALFAKTIEMSFVTVFVSFIGQVLTRRAFIRKSQGMSLAEMTMRNWVIQPGSLVTHFETLPSSAMTILGMLCLTATFASAFYTTASDAMVSPKLKYGKWESKEMSGYIRASYANTEYVASDCPYMFDLDDDKFATESCMNVQFSGMSYRNLLNFMTTWTNINNNGTIMKNDLSKRPYGTMLLYDNTTMYSDWIETEHSNVTAQYEKTGRIINNVTLAMPHPGVYAASTSRVNGILQPDDLSGVGEYAVRAGVVAPAINALCVNMDADELAPLVYTEWPNARVSKTGVSDQVKGWSGWEGDVPQPVNKKNKENYLNRTDVDDIFKWGPEYERRPPVFQLYPYDYNLLANATVTGSDAIYILGKAADFGNYTLCQLRSWTSPNCSTQFNISGTAGASLTAHCEDPNDGDSYLRSFDADQGWSAPSLDWRWLADQWRLSMDMNAGATNSNSSNARILSQLALQEPKLPSSLPSMAEAIAVYASSLVVISAIDTPFRHYWDFNDTNNVVASGPGHLQAFNASLITQQYTSGHIDTWQNLFYVILILVFAMNLLCLGWFIIRSGLVTDFTEPQNIFALAINSPPSTQLNGSCGGGPEKKHLKVPWRVSYAHSANHFFFEEANGGLPSGKFVTETVCTGRESTQERHNSYKRLSNSKGWL
ncbi:hypothetical protein G7Z17_g11098 [Cylindrodendrum hubeiense]|uniref:Mcm2 3 5 family protein n=1 Tax=Cylindrodendrum hubeiense TaxID=595255 RepID=A0A9P5GWH7_9HYPO|nr:hypothetical protein G7Z17_g11098 [Cylindrodendrum hubeiense]